MWSRVLLPAGAAASVLLAASEACADTATAEALFEEGRKLVQAGNYEQACPKFEESLRLQPGMGTEFNLADCQEHIGKTASAWGHYRSVVAAAKLAGQAAREKVAQDRLSRLEPGLCRLSIEVPNGKGLTIERDGAPVGEGQWSTPVPVDPGEHRITAKAPGKRPFERVLTMSACSRPTALTIPTLEDEPNARVSPRAPNNVASGSSEPQTRTVSNGTRTGLIISGLVLTAAGVGIGAGYGAASLSAKNSSAPYCHEDNTCIEPGTTYRADAIRYGDLATVGLVTASVFAVATIAVVVMVPSTKTVTAQNLMRGTVQF